MTTKICKICKEEKDISFFSINRSKSDGRHYNCKPCDNLKAKKWHEDNKEYSLNKKAKYKIENREYYLELDRKRYVQNKEQTLAKRKTYYEQNKDNVLDCVKKWSKKNKNRTRLYSKRHYDRNKTEYLAKSAERRAAKINATPIWLTAIQLAQIQEMYDVALACTVQTGIQHHVDHIYPLQGDGFNGLHVPWNLRVIPAFDNLSKGNSFPLEEIEMAWSSQSQSATATPNR